MLQSSILRFEVYQKVHQHVALILLGLLLFGATGTATTYRAELQPESFVEYEASDLGGTWQGRAPLEALELTFGSEALEGFRLEATLEPGKFDSGNFVRDANARRGVFETGTYPTVTLRADTVETDETGLATDETVRVTLLGTLTMHGVTREISVPAEVSREGGTLRAAGAFTVRLSDYDMGRPSFLGNTVNDEVRVRFEVMGTLSEVEAGATQTP